MATAIEDTKLSGDLIANPDVIWSGEAIPSSTSLESSEFLLGQTLGGVEIKVVCDAPTTLASDLQIELQTSETEGGTFATSNITIATGAILAGDELARFILPREVVGRMFTKIKMTTTAVQATGTVKAYPVYVS